MRGVPYIQVPTTLLAQVDSAVGGKTAVNMPQGKNMVGVFHQPAAVISDTALLSTLPEREMRAGYAEILKYALIDDADFFEWLEKSGAAILAHDTAALAYAVEMACRKKAAIVAQDERDEGLRMLLNLGHTFAHGIEAAAGYNNSVLHGEAVAAGLAMAAEFSQGQGLCDDAARVCAHLQARGLPTGWRDLLPTTAADDMIAAMSRDKKARGGRMTFILSRGIGQAFVARDIDMNDVTRFIKGSA
jgi:3-dehydroquinate synthetase